jgi:sterol desaturase/sphingolipid hydroxylase (fatty acid hydroxylase superfamily)
MELLNKFIEVITWFSGLNLYFLPVFVTLLLYFGFKKRAELSLHAIQNTSATIIVVALNLTAVVLFNKEIYGFAQAVYNSLNIPTLPRDFWSGQLFWLGVLLAILATDFCDYVIHRLMHTRWLWPTHAAHHSDTHVNPFTTFRVHFFEPLLMKINYLVVLTWMQLPELIPAYYILGIILNMYVHMDLDWGHGPFKYIITSPRFHRWHHADAPEAYGKNLANIFPFYDLFFGTYYVPGPCREKMGALNSGIEDKNPIMIWLYPFQEWARLIRESFGKLRAAGQRHGEQPPHRPAVPPAE